MIDLHIHILPGLDDGPEDMAEAVAMSRLAVADGTTSVVATPHMCDGRYDAPRGRILSRVRQLNRQLKAEGIPLKVLPGADIHLSTDLPRLLALGQLLTVNDRGKYVMIELPQDVLPPGLGQVLFEVQLTGATPIISHPERNVDVQSAPALMAELVKAGNLVQLTAASVVGDFGERPERCARDLLRMRLAHVVASDAHSVVRRPPGLSRARANVAELLSSEEAEEIFVRRPERIVAGEYVNLPDPEEWSARGGVRRKGWFRWGK